MSKVYVFLADGFEDIEGLTVVDLLRRAGIETVTVSIKEEKTVRMLGILDILATVIIIGIYVIAIMVFGL